MRRSIGRVSEIEYGGGGTGTKRGHVQEWSRQHRWVERAAAWDAEQDRVRREAHLDEVREMATRHAQLAEAQLRAALEPARVFLAKIRANPKVLDDLSPAELLELAIKASRVTPQLVAVERLARGEPTARVTVQPPAPETSADPFNDHGYAEDVWRAMREAGLAPPPGDAVDDDAAA